MEASGRHLEASGGIQEAPRGTQRHLEAPGVARGALEENMPKHVCLGGNVPKSGALEENMPKAQPEEHEEPRTSQKD